MLMTAVKRAQYKTRSAAACGGTRNDELVDAIDV
jgi:hypothetical protein